MIGSLRGVLLDRTARGDRLAEVIVEVSGVGYRVVITGTSLEGLGQIGSEVLLYVHTHVREDAIVLYGFGTRDERVCFELLIGAHGVGPSVALAMLSVHTPAALRRAVMTEDLDALSLVPGVGKKTAARLVIELKTRFEVDEEIVELPSGVGGDGDGKSAKADVRTALAGLGYGTEEIRMAMAGLPVSGTSQELLKLALAGLTNG